ncbi:hypothetical protein A2153_00765 [Candidatus Gottesmanbacteria bacterium RBG_16_38_7b]|uniref:Uncharacterized protein n=1 Tax=Candidatus Gottesmanbacteria bacterium RBG_16_38_7b TaxID=1798372 RepID=A0A1F5YGC1_9BACT|nr:MAG: hypothetical protein A2153_00765 [Candidatus Gottesmanbacteria bacterium RBG_16_38_7b]
MFSKKNSAIDIQNATGQPLVRELKSSATSDNKKLIGASLIIFLGVFTGFLLSKSLGNKGTGFRRDRIGGTDKEVVGSTDTKTFRDSAEGELEAGGINGEGTHRLIRPGGESQTVALTSSVLDLSQFEGKKVRVWGETFAGQTAGWFMDVGKVEVND